MLHGDVARKALGRGVAQLAEAVRGTLGPRGLNVIVDRLIGAPVFSRDGAYVAREVELEDPFENIGAQALCEVAMKTNELVGDGTTTATVLADAIVQQGLAAIDTGANAVELVVGLERAVEKVSALLRAAAKPVKTDRELHAVAAIAANDPAIGGLVSEALERVGPSGIVTIEDGAAVETLLEIAEGMTFDRGYLSHHMVTEVASMQVVLDTPCVLITDLKLLTQEEVAAIQAVMLGTNRPLLIIAEDVAPACVISLLGIAESGGPRIAAIHPPDYGHWRKSTLEDIAIMTGGRMIAHDLGGRIDQVSARDLGTARQVRISANQTVISAGGGDPEAMAARREQVRHQIELAPPNIERDKLEERLARLAGAVVRIHVGGVTKVEQKRRAQLIEDAVNAARSAMLDGIVAGGGTALLQISPELDGLIDGLSGAERIGATIVRSALEQPTTSIVANAGGDASAVVKRVKSADKGVGFDVRTGKFCNMFEAGIVDPAAVAITALRNAASVAALILTTQTLIAKRADFVDPTAGPAQGGGAEKLGRA
jgi:chaperonin GroEL